MLKKGSNWNKANFIFNLSFFQLCQVLKKFKMLSNFILTNIGSSNKVNCTQIQFLDDASLEGTAMNPEKIDLLRIQYK